jgi:integrase
MAMHRSRAPSIAVVAITLCLPSATLAIAENIDPANDDSQYAFHCTRHTAVTNVYRATRDLFLAQRFARHVSPLTTTVYTHPSDEEMRDRLRGLGC